MLGTWRSSVVTHLPWQAQMTQRSSSTWSSTSLSTLSPRMKSLCLWSWRLTRVGRDHTSWVGVLERHGVGKVNDNGLLLLTKCAEHNLCSTNTMFRMADKFKTTWMHPRSKHWHLIDFIIIRQRDLWDVHVTRAMKGAECWTDHSLIRACQSPDDTATLKDACYADQFQKALERKFQDSPSSDGNGIDKWNAFKNTVSKTAKKILGLKTRIHQGWFDENNEKTHTALDAKSIAYTEWQNNPSSISKRKRFRSL